MNVLETERLALRRFAVEDDAFILELVNDPAWLRFIGEKGVKTLSDARDYLLKGPIDMYERLGFGAYLVVRKGDSTPMGLCGLIKRDALRDVDLGFAFLPPFRGMGYAYEAASAVMAYGGKAFGLTRIVAITSPENVVSARLLEKLGFVFESSMRLGEGGPEVRLFAAVVPTPGQSLNPSGISSS
jgi:RimJ/RimL family protein N-acetyltransferase